jgi:hypothetical protein
MFVQMYTEARSRYHSCRREVFHIMSMCTLVIQHAARMRLTILPSVVCPAVLQFSTLSQIRHDLKKMNIKSLQLLSETFLISRRIEGEITINIHINDLQMSINVFLLLYADDTSVMETNNNYRERKS